MKIEILSGEEAGSGGESACFTGIIENSIPTGSTTAGDLLVYIKKNTLESLARYSLSHTDVELGSILVGDHIRREGENLVVISDFIEARYTDATASSLTFTHETWAYVHSSMSSSYSDKRIVGWHHTHPGYGVFLSQYDRFIQNNFFNLPWQTACVIDPLADSCGFFQNKDGEISRLGGYHLYETD